jgi:hypothetical protein
MFSKNSHAKAQRREEIKVSTLQFFSASLRLCVIFFLLLFSIANVTAQTNGLSDSEIKGRELAQQLCNSQPTEEFKKTGELQIRDGKGNRTNIPVKCEVVLSPTNWSSIYCSYTLPDTNRWAETVEVVHANGTNNHYMHLRSEGFLSMVGLETKGGSPFAGSDFWICDLGLEFFHWPAQKILPKSTNLKRGREYMLLESTNPNPPTNGYSRVLSWIDKETGGILQAEAYDAQGKLLKVFEPKSFKKVNGQWELQEMEIRNVQTGSRTRLEFDLKK